MLTIIGQDIISGNMGYIGTEPGRLYRMGPQSKVAEASGEPPVVLADCKKKPLKGLTLYGRSKQVTTTGAQLISAKTDATEINGITYSSEYGKVTLDGTASADITISIPSAVKLEEGKTYTISSTSLVGVNNVAIYSSIITLDSTVKTAMATGTGTPGILIYIASGTTYHNDELCVMVEEGSTAHPYEPYTGGQPSPSPDYPQEIESAGMKWSTGANLSDAINAARTSTNSTWLIQQNGYSITTQGTYAKNDPNAYKNVRIALDPAIVAGKKITASVEYAENNAGEALRTICDINYERQSKMYWNKFGVNNPITITIPEDVASVNCRIHIIEDNEKTVEHGTYTTTVKGLMVSIGDKVLPWEPYTGGVPKPYGDKIGINVRGKNLLPTTMYSDSGTINGVKFTNNGDGSITAVGTATDMTYFTLYGYNTLGDRGTLPSMEPGDALYISDCLLQQTNSQSVISIDENKSTSFYKSTTTMYAAIRVSKGKNVNKTFFPMISKGSKPIPYEPYHAPQFASISTQNGLPGIPVSSGGNYTDADGQQWVCDEIDFARGMYVQRITKIQANQLKWNEIKETTWVTLYDDSVIMRTVSYLGKVNSLRNNLVRASAFSYNGYLVYSKNIEGCEVADSQIMVRVKVTSFDEAVEKIQDAYFLCVLTTPVEIPLTSEQIAAYKALRTYKGTTIIDNDAGAYMSVKYNT